MNRVHTAASGDESRDLRTSPSASARVPAFGPYLRSRARLQSALENPGTRSQVFAGLDRLTRDADALRPEVQARLDEEMDRLRIAWEVESAAQPTDTAEILEDILLPYVRARVPLRPRALGPTWAHEVLLHLIERFEVYGCVHSAYDHDWRKEDTDANEPGVCVRLALAAGWLGWSDLLVDPASSLSHLHVLVKINDLVDAGLQRGDFELNAFEREAAAAALALEARLLRHWKRPRADGDRTTPD